MTYFERGCAVHGEVSRREGRNCIERVGRLKSEIFLKLKVSIMSKTSIDSTTVGTYKTRMWYCICDNKDGCNKATNLNGNNYLNYLAIISIAYVFIGIFVIK